MCMVVVGADRVVPQRQAGEGLEGLRAARRGRSLLAGDPRGLPGGLGRLQVYGEERQRHGTHLVQADGRA